MPSAWPNAATNRSTPTTAWSPAPWSTSGKPACRNSSNWTGDYQHFHQARPLTASTTTQRQQLRNLVEDLPQVWQAATTTWAERKELLRLLIADVTLTRQEPLVQVQIRWHTNLLDSFPVALPLRGAVPIPEPVIERVRTLSPTHSDRAVAEILNQEGLATAQGKPFTAARVLGVRRRAGIRRPSPHDKNDMCL